MMAPSLSQQEYDLVFTRLGSNHLMRPQIKPIPNEVLLLSIIKNTIMAEAMGYPLIMIPSSFHSDRAPVSAGHVSGRQTSFPAFRAAEMATRGSWGSVI